nr:glycosyltransferase family 87 protein [Galbitalea soli]
MASTEPGGATLVCTAINRATVPTIYPPTAELLFAGVRALVPREAGYWPMQLLGLLASLGITVILLLALRRRGLDPRWAALWAWCPLVAGEAVTNSHIDSVGAGLLLVATLAVATGQRWSGGVALGAAIATKLIPVIGVPALLRRQPWKLVIASVTTFLLLYLPYLISSGPAVLGYLPGYLSEEGYDDGSRFALISVVARGRTAFVVAAVLLVVLAVLVALKTDPRAPWVGQLVMIGVTLLIVSPRYPWYGLLLVPFVAMSGRWEWLAVPLALLARQLEPHLVVLRVGELLAITLIVLVGLARSGPPRREWFRLRGGFGR